MTNFVRRTMVVLVGALALWVAVPAIASAAPATWKLNGSSISESVATSWSGKVKLVDNGATQGVECAETAEGSVGASGTGEVSKLTLSSCVGLPGCESSGATASALNLPWHTELSSVEGTLHDKLVSGGKGTPEIKFLCKVLRVKVEDTCSGTFDTIVTNVTGGVNAAFNASEKLTCSIGGSNKGYLEGSQSVVASKGGTLSAVASPPVWLSEGLPIEGEGKAIESGEGKVSLYVFSQVGTLGVRCEEKARGVAGVAGAGTITELTFSKCEDAPFESECRGKYSIEAAHLPWKTSLSFGAKEAVDETFAADGAGNPDFVLKCETSVGNYSSECAVPLAYLTNTAGAGVFGEFQESPETGCTGAAHGSARFWESHQTIYLSAGLKLRVS
jgi:hypothetical protein